jgi:hypothetical protein
MSANIRSFTMIVPTSLPNKVEVIRTLRTLTGIGLKEAKDASETPGKSQSYPIVTTDLQKYRNIDDGIEECFKILRKNGIQVGAPVHHILDDLRKLAVEALEMDEDELANEILQLVLAEKLRREHAEA